MLGTGILKGRSINETQSALSAEHAKAHSEGGGQVRLGAEDPQPGLGGRVTQIPVDGGQDVELHLHESVLLVSAVAQLLQVANGGNAFLGVLEFGGQPESDAADELVVLLVDDAAGDVAIEDGQGQVEGFGAEAEVKVDLDEEVEEMAAHVPLEFGLLIHGGSASEGLFLVKGNEGQNSVFPCQSSFPYLFLQHPSLDIFAILFLEKQLNASIERAKMVEPSGLALSESRVPLSSEGSFVGLLRDTGARWLRRGGLLNRRRRRRRTPLSLRSRRRHPFPLEDRRDRHALGRQARLALGVVVRQGALARRVHGVDPGASGGEGGGRLSLHVVRVGCERVCGCRWVVEVVVVVIVGLKIWKDDGRERVKLSVCLRSRGWRTNRREVGHGGGDERRRGAGAVVVVIIAMMVGGGGQVEERRVCGSGFEGGRRRNYEGRKSTGGQSTARETRRLGYGKRRGRRRHRRCNVLGKESDWKDK